MFAAATHTSAKETVRPRSSAAGKRFKENGARCLNWVPIATLRNAANCSLFDHLVGAGEQRRRDFEAESFGGNQVKDQFELGGLFDGKMCRVRSTQNFIDVVGGATLHCDDDVHLEADELGRYLGIALLAALCLGFILQGRPKAGEKFTRSPPQRVDRSACARRHDVD